MNYEIKSVKIMSVFMNTLRIFAVAGLAFSILRVSTLPIHISFGRKLSFVAAYTVGYSIGLTLLASFIAFLYNLWCKHYKGLVIHLVQSE